MRQCNLGIQKKTFKKSLKVLIIYEKIVNATTLKLRFPCIKRPHKGTLYEIHSGLLAWLLKWQNNIAGESGEVWVKSGGGGRRLWEREWKGRGRREQTDLTSKGPHILPEPGQPLAGRGSHLGNSPGARWEPGALGIATKGAGVSGTGHCLCHHICHRAGWWTRLCWNSGEGDYKVSSTASLPQRGFLTKHLRQHRATIFPWLYSAWKDWKMPPETQAPQLTMD